MISDGAALSQVMVGERLDPRAHLLRLYPLAPVPPLDHVVATASPLVARVNHGRWIASCDCGARGAPTPGGVVWLDQPLVWCARCQNGGTGRGWRPVVVPPEPVRSRIEAILDCRPKDANRNWEPGETLDDLTRQNLDAGDPVPPDDHPPAVEPAAPLPWRFPPAAYMADVLAQLKGRPSRLGRLTGRR